MCDLKMNNTTIIQWYTTDLFMLQNLNYFAKHAINNNAKFTLIKYKRDFQTFILFPTT